jgi:sigma54-dependent transcription regulator
MKIQLFIVNCLNALHDYMVSRATYVGQQKDLAESESRLARIAELKSGGRIRRTDMRDEINEVRSFMSCNQRGSNHA